MKTAISVLIPLYNKAAEISATLHSVLAQTMQPIEIIVVDDGSTDDSVAVVEKIGSPLIRLIRQENQGVSSARNHAMAEAKGEWVALLDGDDQWTPNYLEEIHRLIDCYPNCGAYATAFCIDDGQKRTLGDTPKDEGLVDFFTESLTHYVLIPSATTLNRHLALELGGFPEGMKLGEDQYLWTKIARHAPICFSPKPLAIYSKVATNRSASIYRAERTPYSFEDLYDPNSKGCSNEYIARAALGKALIISAKGGTAEAAKTAAFFAYTRCNRKALRKLRVLNALPVSWREHALNCYNFLAWKIAKKGL
ncbi:MAG: glycosyltransferase [Alistipes sp.]